MLSVTLCIDYFIALSFSPLIYRMPLCFVSLLRMPLLYGSLNGGRVLAVLFFIGVSLAGLSSLISILEQSVHILEDYGSMS